MSLAVFVLQRRRDTEGDEVVGGASENLTRVPRPQQIQARRIDVNYSIFVIYPNSNR
jgi:hypothetical protein